MESPPHPDGPCTPACPGPQSSTVHPNQPPAPQFCPVHSSPSTGIFTLSPSRAVPVPFPNTLQNIPGCSPTNHVGVSPKDGAGAAQGHLFKKKPKQTNENTSQVEWGSRGQRKGWGAQGEGSKGADEQRWLPARAKQRAAILPGTQRGRTGAGSPPPRSWQQGQAARMYRQGRQTCPEGREELTKAAGAGCVGQSPPPSRTPAQEQHRCGQHRADPAVHSV